MKCLGFLGDLISIWSLLAKSGTMFWFANSNGTLYIDLQSWTSITCNTHAKYSSDLQGCHWLWRWKMSKAQANMGLRQWHKTWNSENWQKDGWLKPRYYPKKQKWNGKIATMDETTGTKKIVSWKVTILSHHNLENLFWFYESLKTWAS